MINWHSSACRRPDVMFLDDIGAPSCLNCGELGTIDDAPSASAPNKSPETPQRADFKLCWPASLPFAEDFPDKNGSRKRRRPTSPVPFPLGGVIAVGDTSAATGSRKNTTAPAKTSLYEPLHARKIRILQLLPGKYHDPICCKIQTVDLKNRPEYEALSYTWADSTGDSSLSQPIYVGDRHDILPITVNCANALRRLRFLHQSRDLWVDAICIDQENIQERSHQVGIMQYIYATALRVLVFLGEDEDDESPETPVPWKYDNQGNTLNLRTDLSGLRYFTRVWVIQEIASARSAWILLGSKGARWEDFLGTLDPGHPTYPTKIIKQNHKRLHNSHPWLLLFTQPKLRQMDEFCRLMIATIGCEASDPRDKVFAILGLFNDARGAGLVANYSLSREQVFSGATAVALHRSSDLWWKVFAAANPACSHNMPSWSVDWATSTGTRDCVRGKNPSYVYTESHGSLKIAAFSHEPGWVVAVPPAIKMKEPPLLRFFRSGMLALRGFSPFSLSECHLEDDAVRGPPGVIEGVHYAPFTSPNDRECGLAKAKWARKTDRAFVVAGLSHHLMILRLLEGPRTYSFVGICRPPNVDLNTHMFNGLSKEAIMVISAWNRLLKYHIHGNWLEHSTWDSIRKTSQHIKNTYEELVAARSAGLSRDLPIKVEAKIPLGTEKLGAVSDDGFNSWGVLRKIVREARSQRPYGNVPKPAFLGDVVTMRLLIDNKKAVFNASSPANSTFIRQACWNWGITRSSEGEYFERPAPWSSNLYESPSVKFFLKALGQMLGGTLHCEYSRKFLTRPHLDSLLRQDLASLVTGYDNVLHNYRQIIAAEDQPTSEDNQISKERLWSFLRGLLDFETDALPGDQDSAPWAYNFLYMCELLDAPWLDEYYGVGQSFQWEKPSIKGEEPRRNAKELPSKTLGLSGVQEPSDLTVEMMWTLLIDLVDRTEKWLLPLERLLTCASDSAWSFPKEFWAFPPFVARAQWDDVYIA